MAAIDLSKAKIGDKFRMRCGLVGKYAGEDHHRSVGSDTFLVEDEGGAKLHFHKHGNYMSIQEHDLDLVEQVFDEMLDTLERDERSNREMKEAVEETELQRRQYVVELAERIFLSNRGINSFKERVKVAERSVNIRKQYLKEGKLC